MLQIQSKRSSQSRHRGPRSGSEAGRLSVGWLTPFGPRSDIGTFSRAILNASVETDRTRAKFVLMVNENGPSYFTPGPVLRLGTPADEEVLQTFDTVVYNIGNNVENHGHINRLALRHPGVVIIHDLVMQHYIAWEAFDRLRDPSVYADLIAAHYGNRGLDTLAASRICASGRRPRYAPWDSAHAVGMPLIEPFVRAAAAVVVHSKFAEEQVRRFSNPLMLRLALPHDQKPGFTDAEVAAWAEVTRRRDRVAFTAFGHIGRGKCLPLLIRAFREVPELTRLATLTVAGYPTDQAHANELVELARRLDLSNVVRFEFAVTPDRLQQLKREADVFVNLRWPNTESASGSLIEQLNTGKPTIVYATGCYAEVPGDAVFLVEPVNSVPAIGRTMLSSARDAERRIAVGAAGREYVQGLAASDYVERLSGFLHDHRSLLRDRQAVHRQLRAADPTQLAELVHRPGTAWARDLALARETMAPILDGAPSLTARSFVQFDDATLRSFIVIGLLQEPEIGSNAELLARLDQLLAAMHRLELFRIVRQATMVKRLTEGPDGPAARELGRPQPHAMELLACFGPETFAASCYILVLGRVPARGESAGYALRLSGGEAATEIMREMLASDEFTARRHTPEIVESLRAGAALAAEVLKPAPATISELAFGVPVSFSNALPVPKNLLLGPWHAPEPEGVWSAGAVARIAIRLAEDSPATQRLRVHLRLPLRVGSPPRWIRASIAGRLVQTLEVPDDKWRHLLVPLPPGGGEGGALVVALDVGCTLFGREVGSPDDLRRLGVMISEIEVLSSAAPALLDPAEPFDFSGRRPPEAMLSEGWHAIEADGVWSNGPTAVLRFAAAPSGGAGQTVHLRLGLPPLPEEAPRQVAVSLDGATVAKACFDSSTPFGEVAIPLYDDAAEGPSVHSIRIECGGAFRPSDIGASDDSRLLGVRLLSVALRPNAPRA